MTDGLAHSMRDAFGVWSAGARGQSAAAAATRANTHSTSGCPSTATASSPRCRSNLARDHPLCRDHPLGPRPHRSPEPQLRTRESPPPATATPPQTVEGTGGATARGLSEGLAHYTGRGPEPSRARTAPAVLSASHVAAGSQLGPQSRDRRPLRSPLEARPGRVRDSEGRERLATSGRAAQGHPAERVHSVKHQGKGRCPRKLSLRSFPHVAGACGNEARGLQTSRSARSWELHRSRTPQNSEADGKASAAGGAIRRAAQDGKLQSLDAAKGWAIRVGDSKGKTTIHRRLGFALHERSRCGQGGPRDPLRPASGSRSDCSPRAMPLASSECALAAASSAATFVALAARSLWPRRLVYALA